MKKVVILLVILAALVGFAFFYKKTTDERTSGYNLSKADSREYLMANLSSDKVRKIVIQDSKGKTSLAVVGDQWVVEERGGYPASFQKLQHAVQALEDLKIKDRKEVGKSALAKLNVLAPGEQQGSDGTGLEVQFLDEKGTVLAGVIAGSSPKSSGGASSGKMFGGPTPQRFVRTPNDKDTVWVVDDSFDEFQVDPKSWIDTSWPLIAEVRSVELTFPNAADSWKADRKTPEDAFAFVGAPAGEELDTAKASNLTGRVLEGPPTDVLPKDKVTPDTLKGAIKAKVITFDGFTYDIDMLEKKKEGEEENSYPGYLVSFKVTAEIAKERKPGADEKEEDKKKLDEEFKKLHEEITKRFASVQKMQGWVFEMSQFGVSSLVKKRSELLRDKPEALKQPVPGALMPPDAPPIQPKPISIPKVIPAPPASIAKPEEKPAPAPSADKPAETKPAAPAPAETKPADPAAPTPAPADKPAEAKPTEEKPATPAPAPAPAPAEKPADAASPAAPAEKPAESKPASS